jgi:hypothetical protein
VAGFCDLASIRLAIAGAPGNMPTSVKFSAAVQHLTTAPFLPKPAEPLLHTRANGRYNPVPQIIFKNLC